MPRTLTQERQWFLFHVFTTALEGGIGYWSVCSTYHWIKDGGLTRTMRWMISQT